MSASSWPGIRPGSTRVEVYNEGLLVSLCDEGNLPAILASGADFETGYAETDAAVDATLKKLAKAGTLLAYELVQDDAVVAEVVVGPPLTKKELTVGRWLKPQSGFLKLPSGVLRIDSANTLPIEDETPEEEPGRVQVPPGDYVLNLYRLDWDKLAADGLLNAAGEWPGPQEVLVLTPHAGTTSPKGIKPLLRLPAIKPATWQGKYKLAGGVFRGLAFSHHARLYCSLNLDAAAAQQLGIVPGSVLRIEVGGLTLDGVYVNESELSHPLRQWAKQVGAARGEFSLISRPTIDAVAEQTLYCERIVAAADFPQLKKWIPAQVTLLAERLEPPTVVPPESKSAVQQLADELAEIEAMFDEE